MMQNEIVLGIDPGSRVTGYGLITLHANTLHYLDSGCIRMQEENMMLRLKTIYHCLAKIVQEHSPTTAAIEQVFMHASPGSALKLGQARGAAIVAVVEHEIPLGEYSARQIKQAVVGTGSADKQQVQQMVTSLLNLPHRPQADAADALAVAICHINTQNSRLLRNCLQTGALQ